MIIKKCLGPCTSAPRGEPLVPESRVGQRVFQTHTAQRWRRAGASCLVRAVIDLLRLPPAASRESRGRPRRGWAPPVTRGERWSCPRGANTLGTESCKSRSRRCLLWCGRPVSVRQTYGRLRNVLDSQDLTLLGTPRTLTPFYLRLNKVGYF